MFSVDHLTSQFFLDLGKASYNKCNILSVMDAIFPLFFFFPPVLLCRVDVALCMFKNSQPPTQPSAITPCVGKYLSRTRAIKIPLILQKFVQITFSRCRL